MSWLSSSKDLGHVTEAIIHFNEAEDRMHQRSPKTEVSRLLSNALNKIQAEWTLCARNGAMGEVKAFQTMVLKELAAQARVCFLSSNELKNLVEFEPHIMNHNTLKDHGYRPDSELTSALIKKATEEHRKLRTAVDALLAYRNDEVEIRVLKRTAELLYVVRSNIAHGEKTPYGPDKKKKERDEKVSTV
jgi:hypothetical protein